VFEIGDREGLEDGESLVLLKGTRISKVKMMRVVSTGIKGIEGVSRGRVPVLKVVSLEGSAEFRLDEEMRKAKVLLQQVEYFRMEVGA
jgi:hypothetical protein